MSIQVYCSWVATRLAVGLLPAPYTLDSSFITWVPFCFKRSRRSLIWFTWAIAKSTIEVKAFCPISLLVRGIFGWAVIRPRGLVGGFQDKASQHAVMKNSYGITDSGCEWARKLAFVQVSAGTSTVIFDVFATPFCTSERSPSADIQPVATRLPNLLLAIFRAIHS